MSSSGGSWWYRAEMTKVGGLQYKPADFYAVPADFCAVNVGFRCVRDSR